jgi:hypothetical protein
LIVSRYDLEKRIRNEKGKPKELSARRELSERASEQTRERKRKLSRKLNKPLFLEAFPDWPAYAK